MTVGGVWLAQFCIIGFPLAFGAMESFYAQDYLSNFTPSQINWIGMLETSLLSKYGYDSVPRLHRAVFHVSTWFICRQTVCFPY